VNASSYIDCVRLGLTASGLDARYAFDRVFDKNSTQEEVFNDTAKPLLQGLFEGFNATVFAYGVSRDDSCFHSPTAKLSFHYKRRF
jgi:hypothetical protein